jgi:hypothetical protein
MGLWVSICDLRSGIRVQKKTYPRSRIQGLKKHQLPDP